MPHTDYLHEAMKFETLAVHAGRRPETATGSVAPPLYLSTTFERDARMMPLGGHTYIRESNPMQTILEDALAPLEGGTGALVFASGMAAGVALLVMPRRVVAPIETADLADQVEEPGPSSGPVVVGR